MNTTLVALLDKTWPPEHSFVDGMLASVAADLPGLKVRLCVSGGTTGKRLGIRRYHRVSCIPCLHERRGTRRLLNFFMALGLIRHLARRERKRHHRVILFVRNDPMLLLAAAVHRHRIDRLVFQTSFPHEKGSGRFVKRLMARLLYAAASRKVDAITAVSPLGLERAQKMFPHCTQAVVIPLLCDLPFHPQTTAGAMRLLQGSLSVSFIYIGTHSPKRGLETILEGIVQSVNRGAVGTFLFAGAGESDISRLSVVKGVRGLMEKRIVTFRGPVPRSQIPVLLADAHVGLSLIPPSKLYAELSPAKLVEYMGAGLAVLATYGIPAQEQIIAESNGGMLVQWHADAIAQAILSLTGDVDRLKVMMASSREYASKNLQYTSRRGDFQRLLALQENPRRNMTYR